MPTCLRCGTELPVNEEGMAPVLCDRCAGAATSRARRSLSAVGTMRDFPATTALVAINLAVFVGMVLTSGSLLGFSPEVLIRWGANFGPLTYSGDYWRLVTAGFVHGGIIHMALNMWCLWSLGQLSERLFGRWVTLAVYILTGVAGALLSIGWNPNRLEVGASGAVFGLAGAILSGIKFGNVSVSSWQKRSIFSSLIFFVIFNFAFGMAPGVDNMCHLGGFISGIIFGAPLATASSSGKKSFEWATIVLATLVLGVVGNQLIVARGQSSRIKVAAFSIEDHDYDRAIRLLEQVTAADPNDSKAYALLGDAYFGSGLREKAADAYKRALQLDPNNADAKDGLAELQSHPTGDPAK